MSLNLVLAYEQSALAAPQSFRDGMQAAANILDSLILNNITVTIQVGYGDWDNQFTVPSPAAEGGDLFGLTESYTTLRAALASHETSSADQTFVNSLPNASSVNGVSSFYVPSAVAKALGQISATNATVDGAVGMGKGIPSSLLIGVALHELTHAMGREPGVGPFDLFRYTSPGQHLFSGSATAPAAFFSIDGGNTKLADFGQTSDSSDFLNSGVQGSPDPFNEFYSSSTQQNLTAVDKELMDVLGFNTTPGSIAVSATSSKAQQGGAAITLLSGPPTITDSVSTTLSSATIKIVNSGGSAVAGDELFVNGQQSGTVDGGLVAVSWNDSSKILTLTGNASIAAYQTLLSEISYKDSGTDSSTGSHPQHTVTWIVNDGTSNLSTTSQIAIERPPVVTAANVTLNAGYMSVAASSLFPASDPDSDAVTAYGFMDTGNGHFVLNGVAQANNVEIDVTSSQLSQLTYQNAPGTDTVQVRASDGTMWGNWASFTVIGPVVTVIEAFGSTSLVQVGSNYFLYPVGGSSGPELNYNGAPVVAGEFGAYAPIGAEQTASGYDLAWKMTGGDSYGVWGLKSDGTFISNLLSPTSGTNSAFESFEPVFQQDLNGDGVIGLPTTVIEAFGSTTLVQVGSNYFLYAHGTTSGPELSYNGAPVVAGEFGAYAPIGAEQTASGYEVAWKVPGADAYTACSTDSNGNYIANIIGTVSGSALALETLEPSFHQDLNGDGLIGPPPIVIESNGSTHLTQVGNHFFLYDSNGVGPSLKFGGTDVVAGQFGAWSPIGAEQTASGGYEVAWKVPGADAYTACSTDSNGNYIANIVGTVSGSAFALETLEPSFHQDLNGDGVIGSATAAANEFSTSSNAFSIALGPGGNLWFTEPFGNMIGEITPAGAVSEFASHGNPGGIVSDGTKLWFTEIGGNAIGSITTSGQFGPDIPIPTAGAFAHEIAVDASGNIWFAEAGSDKIGELLASNHTTIKEFAIPTAGGAPFDIVAGPDGNMWFTEIHSNKIGKITPAGVVTEFTVGDHPSYITAGPDGKMWFSEADTEQSSNPNKIGTINTDGSGFTEFSPPTAGSKPQGITVGSDGKLWFTEEAGNKIGQLTTDGHFSEFGVPTGGSAPFGIVTGSDGNIWFTEFAGNKIGEANPPPVVTVPNSSVQATSGQVFQASSLFSASDADHDTLTYTFYDATSGNGHFALNGQVEPNGQSFSVSAANLPNLTFVAGQSGSDTLSIAVSDGHTLTDWHTLVVSVPSHTQPAPAADAHWHQLG